MHILGPHLANAMTIQISGHSVELLLGKAHIEIEEGNFKLLDICHHFTAGMKAIATEMQYKGTDECRQACGGVGYHIASGLVSAFTDHATMPTFEGVNVLMLQQSSRYLFKLVKKAKAGKTLKREFSYIN